MNNTIYSILSWGGNIIALFASAVSDNPVAQWILFALGIIGSLLSIALSLLKVFTKWKQINADGKITEDEMKEFSETIDAAKKEVEQATKKSDNKEKED